MAWLQARTTNSANQSKQSLHFKDWKLFIRVFKVNVDYQYIIHTQQTLQYYQHNIDRMEDSNQPVATKIPPIYLAETAFKAAFIFMAVLNLQYTITVAFLASICGLIRMLKTPQFNKLYLQKVLMNNHGQNILYIGMGCVGNTNFLFFAPLILYFAYGLAQFFNLKFPGGTGNPKIRKVVDQVRTNRWYFMETKSRLQIIYFIYLLVTIPIDFSRILKCLLIGQYNMLKFRLSPETKHAATNINNFINSKISGISFLHKLYNKLIDYIYKFATQQPGQR